MNQSPQPRPNRKNAILISLSIILAGALVATGVLMVTGSVQYTWDGFVNLLPKFAKYQKLSDPSSFTSIDSVLNSQPAISYNSNAKYIIAEVTDYDCISCANFHGFAKTDNSYQNVMKDFVEKGLFDYTVVDKLNVGEITKSSSAYCVAEQDPGKFFEYKEELYKNVSSKATLDSAKEYLKRTKQTPSFDQKKFEDCYNSSKYDSRVHDLSDFATDFLSANSTPVFVILSVSSKDVKKLDGSTAREKTYTKISTITGNQDYKLFFKPELERVLKL